MSSSSSPFPPRPTNAQAGPSTPPSRPLTDADPDQQGSPSVTPESLMGGEGGIGGDASFNGSEGRDLKGKGKGKGKEKETTLQEEPFKPHPTLFGDQSIDHALAGLGAGTVATLIMHPLDLVKVRFQLATTPRPRPSPSSSSSSSHPSPTPTPTATTNPTNKPKPRLGTAVYHALKDAVKQDGYSGLYRGLGPNLVGGAGSWGLYFLFYNMIKAQMQGDDPTYKTSPQQHLLAAAEASAITAMLTNPIWVVKTRVFGSTKNSPEGRAYKGLWNELSKIYTHEGIRGLYKGSLLALVGVSNGSIQFATYEEIKRRRTEMKRKRIERAGGRWGRGDEKLSNTEYILASGSSKLAAIALTYPYQVIRARIQNKPTAHLYPNIPTTIARTFREEGFRAFYKGLGTNALRILPGTCTTFVVYENLVWAFRGVADWRDNGAGRGGGDGVVVKG